jgi:hypothetical protein
MRCMGWMSAAFAAAGLGLSSAAAEAPEGFVPLFNGKDFTGWKILTGGIIDYDAKSEAKGERSLFSEKSFKDFILRIDWRLKDDQPGYMNKVPHILPDGSHKKDDKGNEIKIEVEDVDSGIYLRGQSKAQVNIWMWPIGSGEVYGYRTDKKMPPEVRAGVTPKKKMDRPRGQWNTFEITMKGDRLWVNLNGEEVITGAQLPGIKSEGPIALQHHGGWDAKKNRWNGPPSLVQFKNIYVKELK